MTKKVWNTPSFESQEFTPNSFVAACAKSGSTSSGTNYQLVKISDVNLNLQGQVWLDSNKNNRWDGATIDKQTWGLQNGYPNQQYIYNSQYFVVTTVYRGWLQPYGSNLPLSSTPTHWFIKYMGYDAGQNKWIDMGEILRASATQPVIYTANKS